MACAEAEKVLDQGTDDKDKLVAENNKLKYRILHMQRAYDSITQDESKDIEIERLKTEN